MQSVAWLPHTRSAPVVRSPLRMLRVRRTLSLMHAGTLRASEAVTPASHTHTHTHTRTLVSSTIHTHAGNIDCTCNDKHGVTVNAMGTGSAAMSA